MTRRQLNLVGFLICVALLGYAYYAQTVLNLEPCPLCIFQRVGVAAIGAVFLLAFLHGPRDFGGGVYGVLVAIAALVTIGIAARHVYIQHLPEDQVPACGATLEYLREIFPLTTVIRKVLTGSGECAKVTWTFLTLSMPTWVLLAAAALGSYGLFVNFRKPRPRYR
jgi:disulfide bond formation protein DsbB